MFKCIQKRGRFYEYKNALKSWTLCRLSSATVPTQRFERMKRKGSRLLEAQLCVTSRKFVNCENGGAATQFVQLFLTCLTSHKIVSVLHQSSLSHYLSAKQASRNDRPTSPSAHQTHTTLATRIFSVCVHNTDNPVTKFRVIA